VFSGLVVGIEEIVVVGITIELEHFSYEFCCCVAFAQGDVLPRGCGRNDNAFGVGAPVNNGP
jgi:hypothetical protein